jgi:hypothetical protein
MAGMKRKKGEVTKLRPFEGDLEIAKKLSSDTGIPVSTILSLALAAGLRAIKANNWSMPTPLSMKVVPAQFTDRPGEPIMFPSHGEDPLLAAEDPVHYAVKKKKAG